MMILRSRRAFERVTSRSQNCFHLLLEIVPMRLVPVIDLLRGNVVHAVRGERASYQPVQSVLCHSSTPADIAAAFVREFASREVYVADLDAIGGSATQWDALRDIHQAGLQLQLDAGLAEPDDVQQLLAGLHQYGMNDTRIVIGLETWASPTDLSKALSLVGSPRLNFSIDLRAGQPITACDLWPRTPLAIAERAVGAGIGSLVLLDLAQVGTGQGPATESLCRELKARWSHVEIACGGGIRNLRDCQRLELAGCDRVLIATALHRGEITARDFQ